VATAAIDLRLGQTVEDGRLAKRTDSPIDYDAVAPGYDRQPYRAKPVDPELRAFVASGRLSPSPAILDIACGTGNQLVSDRPLLPGARLVGVDRSLGMLREASRKAADIVWVQADGTALPFSDHSFDFATCQFGFHHMADKARMLADVLRVLRRGGRFVMRNVCPHEQPDSLFYDYFPEAYATDLSDFWPPDRVAESMRSAGFVGVAIELEHHRSQQDLRMWREQVGRRAMKSQLMTISDEAYRAGLQRLDRELEADGAPLTRADHACLVTIRGDRRPE
jgi:ubiquinone/menaquinone biosynthesis C-methylase UbiE